MYHFDYDLSTNDSVEKIPPMMFHIRMFALAVKYAVHDLQELVAIKFQAEASSCWESDDFVLAINEIYSSTHSSEQALRQIAADVACNHADVLLNREDFSLLLNSNGEFACGMLKALHFQKVSKPKCGSCGGILPVSDRKGNLAGSYCHSCGGYHQGRPVRPPRKP